MMLLQFRGSGASQRLEYLGTVSQRRWEGPELDSGEKRRGAEENGYPKVGKSHWSQLARGAV